MLIGVVLNYFIPEQVFVYVTSVALVGSLWTWALIVIAHLGYRRAVDRGEAAPVSFRMPGAPYTNWLVLIFLGYGGDLPRRSTRAPGSRSTWRRSGSPCSGSATIFSRRPDLQAA